MDKKIILLTLTLILVSSGCMETEEQKSALNVNYTQKTGVNAGEGVCSIDSDECADNASAKKETNELEPEEIPKIDSCEGAKESLSLGEDAIENKSYDAAVEYYTEAIQVAPDCSEAYFMRGFVHGTLGFTEEKSDDYYKAIEDFDKVLEIDPGNSNALYYKGLCLSNLGEKEKAKEAYKKALEINPDDARAKEEYEKLSDT